MTQLNGPGQDSPYPLKPDPYTCESCGKTVEPILVDFPKRLGGTRYLQGRCACEIQKNIDSVERFKNFERMNRLKRYFSFSTLGQRFTAKTFDNFHEFPENSASFKEAKEFINKAQSNETRGKGLLIIGPVGTGKSHLGAAIFNCLSEKKTCIFANVPELLEKIRDSLKTGESEEIINEVKRCEVLIFDDLGAERHKHQDDWATEKLFTIVDYRYRNLLPIVATTNCKPDVLEDKIGYRIMSRLREICTLTLCGGDDYRKHLASERGA